MKMRGSNSRIDAILKNLHTHTSAIDSYSTTLSPVAARLNGQGRDRVSNLLELAGRMDGAEVVLRADAVENAIVHERAERVENLCRQSQAHEHTSTTYVLAQQHANL
jgi:uncharacterized protein YicC (UPF0701 family)